MRGSASCSAFAPRDTAHQKRRRLRSGTRLGGTVRRENRPGPARGNPATLPGIAPLALQRLYQSGPHAGLRRTKGNHRHQGGIRRSLRRTNVAATAETMPPCLTVTNNGHTRNHPKDKNGAAPRHERRGFCLHA